jgi:hypothetical protein
MTNRITRGGFIREGISSLYTGFIRSGGSHVSILIIEPI